MKSCISYQKYLNYRPPTQYYHYKLIIKNIYLQQQNLERIFQYHPREQNPTLLISQRTVTSVLGNTKCKRGTEEGVLTALILSKALLTSNGDGTLYHCTYQERRVEALLPQSSVGHLPDLMYVENSWNSRDELRIFSTHFFTEPRKVDCTIPSFELVDLLLSKPLL